MASSRKQSTPERPQPPSAVETAVQAVERGYQPIPILSGLKKVGISSWTRMRWDADDLDQVREKFTEWRERGQGNIGLLLGEPSNGLIDVDIDHPRAMRLRDYFLPPTAMRTGRAGTRNSHYWYRVTGQVPGTRRYKMPRLADQKEGEVSVELRSTRAQTVIPPSLHPSGEAYLWEGEPWGGDDGPAEVDAKMLSVRVATLGLAAVLVDNWPHRGGRHDAYLALAGGLLRYGDAGRVHPFWERALPGLIGPLAEATRDEDGPETRIKEVMSTTLSRLHRGEEVVGFGTLRTILGEGHVNQVQRMVREVASLAGFESEFSLYVDDISVADDGDPQETLSARKSEAAASGSLTVEVEDHKDKRDVLDAEFDHDPLGARACSWERVNLDPYIAGEVRPPTPEILQRDDGQGLMYQGRVNMLYGSSESAKSWLALTACMQEMSKGERVMYLDFEDEPVNTLDRLNRLGAGIDDIRLNFAYIRPEDPLESMERNRWGQPAPTATGRLNQTEFEHLVSEVDPSLVIVDGMTVLYGLHGLDTNDSSGTDVITNWLKGLTRNGRSTVIVIDHTVKNPERGTMPIGSQHKVAMVQGTLLQVWPVKQPRRGYIGLLDLIVMKDRLGSVREVAGEPRGKKVQIAARVEMDSTEAGTTTMSIKPPANTPEQDAALALQRSKEAQRAEAARRWEERVLHVFGGELDKALAMRDIVEPLLKFEGATRQVRKAVHRLVNQGWLERSGATRNTTFTLIVGGEGYDMDPLEGEQESAEV